MVSRNTMNVSLTPELEKFVAGRIASGRYLSASEVVREGLRLLEQQELAREALRQQIVGLKQARAGKLVDGEQALNEIERSSIIRSRPRRKAG